MTAHTGNRRKEKNHGSYESPQEHQAAKEIQEARGNKAASRGDVASAAAEKYNAAVGHMSRGGR